MNNTFLADEINDLLYLAAQGQAVADMSSQMLV